MIWQPYLFLRFAVSCFHCHSSRTKVAIKTGIPQIAMEFFLQFEVFSVYTVIDVSKLTSDTYLICPKQSVYTIVCLGSKLDFFLGDQSPQGIFLF